jgi:hypothetical protein
MRFEASTDLLHAAVQCSRGSRVGDDALEERTQGCETAGDYACATFDSGPYGDVDGSPEEVVNLDEAFDVTKAKKGAYDATTLTLDCVL